MTDHSFAENYSELGCCHLKKLKRQIFGKVADLLTRSVNAAKDLWIYACM